MKQVTEHLPLLPGAIYHSRNHPEILFVLEAIAAHGQSCDQPMVQYRAITPTRDAPAGSLWTMDTGIFRNRMCRLTQPHLLDILWDGAWPEAQPHVGATARQLLSLSVLDLIQRTPQHRQIVLARSGCLWTPAELSAFVKG